ncbi:MAG: hypothetical protein GX050_11005 [Firmicutes bacterium]|nr:hypothetical protein [Bacillota bacterium]
MRRTEYHPQRAFSPNGLFAQWPEFEYRPAQQEMSSLVWWVLERGGTALIEAGTGTGKSLAYLYPLFAQERTEKSTVIIATYTLNLQQQLMEKEVPFLMKIFGAKSNVALLFGRGNYLCRRKLDFYRQHPDLLNDREQSFIHRLGQSVAQNRGCLEELGYALPPGLKDKLVSEAETCLRKACPYQAKCFWAFARKRAFEADIVIVNHHLFFTDLGMRIAHDFNEERLVLPAYQYVIFDEAQHLEAVAGEYLGLRLDELEIERFCNRLLHKEGRWGKGWLVSLRQRLGERCSDLAVMQRCTALLEMQIIPELLTLADLWRNFFQLLAVEHKSFVATEETVNNRFSSNLLADQTLNEQVQRIQEQIASWTKNLSLLVDEMQIDEEMMEDTIFLAEAGRFFQLVGRNLPLLLDGTDEEFVNWVAVKRERDGAGKTRTILHRVPLRLGDILAKELFSKVNGAVLTSATLAVGEDFTYIKERLGLDWLHPAERREIILESPFDYQRNVLVLIGQDLPSPEDPAYLTQVSKWLPEIIRASEGRCLLLFTNRRQMLAVYDRISSELEAEGFQLLRQGAKPRPQLVNAFRRSKKAVLLGMDSFWEGIDLPGPQLSNVVLMRLPFRVPTEPLFQAKWEALQKEGKDPFLHLSLPEAVIKFKQGYGRLIRSQSDRGVVVILDQRVSTRSYGPVFLQALPGGQIVTAPIAQIPSLVAEWLV